MFHIAQSSAGLTTFAPLKAGEYRWASFDGQNIRGAE
jgi:hypothetical protein